MSGGFGGELVSPGWHRLRQLEGSPEDLHAQAQDLKSAAHVMNRAAEALQRLADGTDTISQAESVDAVREAAGGVAPALDKAATRYQFTGEALIEYADALGTAQRAIGPMIEDIEAKHAVVQEARDAQANAEAVVRGQATAVVVVEPVTDTQRADADRDLVNAGISLSRAEEELTEAWEGFDRTFGVWEDAYDRAVERIDDAFELAGNNDAWGEDFLTILGYIGVGLSIIALFCTGPLAVVIMAIGAAIAAVTLAINIAKMTKGRGNWLDVGMSIAGLIPFVRPLGALVKGAKAGSLGIKSAQQVFATGRGMLGASVRSTFKTFKPLQLSGKLQSALKLKNPIKAVTWIDNGSKATTWLLNGANNLRAFARTGMLQAQFSIKNGILYRPSMNFLKGGPVNANASSFGDFVRSKGADVVGKDMIDWADTYAPHLPKDWGAVGENGVTFVVNSVFLAEEHTGFGEYAEKFDQ